MAGRTASPAEFSVCSSWALAPDLLTSLLSPSLTPEPQSLLPFLLPGGCFTLASRGALLRVPVLGTRATEVTESRPGPARNGATAHACEVSRGTSKGEALSFGEASWRRFEPSNAVH